MNPFSEHSRQFILSFSQVFEACDFFHSLNMEKLATFLVPLVTSSVGDSALIIHFQEAYARLFSNCYNKHGIQSNLPSYRPMNQGTICAKVDLEGVQPVKGNNCGLIPPSVTYTDLRILHRTLGTVHYGLRYRFFIV